ADDRLSVARLRDERRGDVIELIPQRTAYDCGICTIAMATGRSYEEVMAAALAAKAFDEIGLRSEQWVLERLGLDYSFENGEPVGDFVCRHRGVLAPEFFRSFAGRRRAIMAVPSLNIEKGFHSVFWDGRRLFDPC